MEFLSYEDGIVLISSQPFIGVKSFNAPSTQASVSPGEIQMILAIIPLVDLWASYRIMKLRLWLLILWLGFAILGTLSDWAIYGDKYWDLDTPFFPTEPTAQFNFILISAIEIIVAVILMRKWTIEWNKKIESEGNMGPKDDDAL